MGRRRWLVVLAAAGTAGLSGCVPGSGLPPLEASASPAGAVAAASATGTAEPSDAPQPSPAPTFVPGAAPSDTYAVGVRQLDLRRDNRPLRTLVWYPRTNVVGGAEQSLAAGVFPLVLFSHGLTSNPEAYQGIATRFAAAGFVVAAPAYPYTNSAADPYNPADLINQPADASAVITAVLSLAATPGDPLAGHVDASRVGAAGHSAGAYTTVGLLSGARDNRVRAAIVVAGGSLGGSFTGPAASVLFVHGDKDPVVSYPIGQAIYQAVPWPKAFLTVVDGDHSSYLYAPTSAAGAVWSTMLDFLRWTLYGDETAKARIPAEAVISGATEFESVL